ncbi:MAG TPA: alpha/beta fold hydrolase [Ktedonobacteraceae bacterium]|jgi:proline iminopeptidase
MARLSQSQKRAPVQRAIFSTLGWLVMVLSLVLGVLGAGAAFFGAALFFSASGVLVMVALVVGFLLTCGGTWIAARIMTWARSGRIALGIGAATMLVLALVSSFTVFQPLPSTPVAYNPPPAPAGVRYWSLSTGSHIAYLKVSAQGKARATPILLVGGGPGEEDVANTSETQFFGQLAHLGYDVYFYDQIGSGLSARLADPGQYTLARHIADLEAIREEIGAPQVILMGESWGGTLVANYMATYPQYVAKAIFTSPAPINQAEWIDFGSVISRLPAAEQKQVNQMLASPRFLAWYLLGRINPRAAHSLVSDREADAFFNTFLQRIAPGTVCDPAHASTQVPLGNGFYDNIFTTNDAKTQHGNSNPRAKLASNHTPTLILTGTCNYIKWAATWQYKTTLPNSTLLYFPHAGHEIYLDQPDLYLATIRAFLLGTSLPLHPWTTAQPPLTLQEPPG